jgi:hypothetical protein
MSEKTPETPPPSDQEREEARTDEPADLPPPLSARDFESAEELEEVFRVGDEIGASAAIDEILAPAGIEAFRHDRRSHALPVPGFPGEIGVAVHRTVADRARVLLREAKNDGALPEGTVVGGGGEGPAVA